MRVVVLAVVIVADIFTDADADDLFFIKDGQLTAEDVCL